MNVEYLPIDSITLDKNQPRKIFDEESLGQLKESIREKGIEVPLIVREFEEDDSIYILLDGERRYRSAKALNLREVPCIIDTLKSVHPKMHEIDIVSKQLRLDFLKNKLTGEELDAALYELWFSLETLPQEVLDSMGVRTGTNRDWRVPFISRETGIGYTQIQMSLNKEDFKRRNEEFHKNVIDDIGTDPIKNRRYNRILGETARHEGLRTDDEKRKTVVREYLNEAVSGDGKELRENLKKISETRNPSEEEVRKMFGLPSDKKSNTDKSSSNNHLDQEEGINLNSLHEDLGLIADNISTCQFGIEQYRHVLRKCDSEVITKIKKSALKILKCLKENTDEKQA